MDLVVERIYKTTEMERPCGFVYHISKFPSLLKKYKE